MILAAYVKNLGFLIDCGLNVIGPPKKDYVFLVLMVRNKLSRSNEF